MFVISQGTQECQHNEPLAQKLFEKGRSDTLPYSANSGCSTLANQARSVVGNLISRVACTADFQRSNAKAMMLRALKEAGWTWSDDTLSTVVADLSREGIDDPNALQGERPFCLSFQRCCCLQFSGCLVEDVGGHAAWPKEARDFIAELMKVSVAGTAW